LFETATPEERRALLARLSIEERLADLALEQRLAGLTPEQRAALARLLQTDPPPPPSE
jgi:hypothetical protein